MTAANYDSPPEWTDRSLLAEEVDDLGSADESPTSVTYTTQDYPIDGLVKRLSNGSMLVPQFGEVDKRVSTAGFQRGFVWTKAQMDKFIESLLLGYPIPGIFLVRQTQDNRLLVLDGQQRLETLRRFYEGLHEDKVFLLSNVGEAYKGSTYKSLDEELQRKLDDSYMQATIVTADGTDEVDDAIYQIFERLNSGGTQLTPHEIRVALYAGTLVASVEALNDDQNWRSLYGRKSKRIRDHELVMRILAMYENSSDYARPLKGFLNSYVKANRSKAVDNEDSGSNFKEASRLLEDAVGVEAFRSLGGSQVNSAQTEAVMVSVMEAIRDEVEISDLASRVATLRSDDRFAAATTRATADTDQVSQRLARARTILRNE